MAQIKDKDFFESVKAKYKKETGRDFPDHSKFPNKMTDEEWGARGKEMAQWNDFYDKCRHEGFTLWIKKYGFKGSSEEAHDLFEEKYRKETGLDTLDDDFEVFYDKCMDEVYVLWIEKENL